MKYFNTEIRNNILIAYFNYPEKLNCFGLDSAKEFRAIINSLHKKKIQGFLLTSEQHVFCSGGNLSDYANLKKKSDGIKINKEITKIFAELDSLPIPTVCLVTGDCFGGGIEWISAFDRVYSTPSVFFGMWQRKIGLSWGWGGGGRLKKRIHKKQLLHFLLQAKTISALEAQNIGLIDRILPHELIIKAGLDFLERHKTLPQIPFKKIKGKNLKNEQKIFESLWLNPEHQRLLSKFR